jgi:zinc-binding alcohol dehydrogenase/oxidoreductase
LSLLGTTMGSPADWSAMVSFVGRHKLRPIVTEVFPLERAGDAFALMERSEQFGKIVVRVAG